MSPKAAAAAEAWMYTRIDAPAAKAWMVPRTAAAAKAWMDPITTAAVEAWMGRELLPLPRPG